MERVGWPPAADGVIAPGFRVKCAPLQTTLEAAACHAQGPSCESLARLRRRASAALPRCVILRCASGKRSFRAHALRSSRSYQRFRGPMPPPCGASVAAAARPRISARTGAAESGAHRVRSPAPAASIDSARNREMRCRRCVSRRRFWKGAGGTDRAAWDPHRRH